MKKGTSYPILFVLIASILVTPSFAHSGRTDANGGHRVSSTGEYHYHHGYPAHQHTGGSCPYDFDDKTGQNSGSSSSGDNKTSSNSKPNSSTPSAAKPPAKTKKSIDPTILAGAAGILSVCAVKYTKQRARIREERRRYEEARAKYTSLYGGKTRNELARLAGMPSKVIIGEDNLPREAFGSAVEKWGYNYTFYVSRSGKAFHGTRSCQHTATIPKNAVNLGDRTPCKLCRPYKPDIKWYWEYRKIISTLEKYHIDIPEE